MFRILFCSLILACLGGCAMQEGNFPSLAKRAIESEKAVAETIASPDSRLTSLPGGLQIQVDAAVQKSNSAHAKFLKNLPTVKRRVSAAQGAAVSSETWVVAQMDMAALEIGRSPSVSALADIDALYVERMNAEYDGAADGGARLIAQYRQKIAAQVRLQQDETDAMKAMLR